MQKILSFMTLICAVVSSNAYAITDKAKAELDLAMQGDYQALRNVAFSMSQGGFGFEKNPVSSCALRKVILIAKQDKTDITDYNNEHIDCKGLTFNENEKAWRIALTVLSEIMTNLQNQKKGK